MITTDKYSGDCRSQDAEKLELPHLPAIDEEGLEKLAEKWSRVYVIEGNIEVEWIQFYYAAIVAVVTVQEIERDNGSVNGIGKIGLDVGKGEQIGEKY